MNGALHNVEIDAPAQCGGFFVGLAPFPHKNALIAVLPVDLCHNGLDENKGELRQQMLLHIVKEIAHRISVSAQQAFQPIKYAEEMADVNHLAAAAADHNIFGVIGHAGNLVGDHLSDGQNRVIIRIQQLPVNGHGHTAVKQAFRKPEHNLCGNAADLRNGSSKIVGQIGIHRNALAKHLTQFIRRHWNMRAECGQYLDRTAALCQLFVIERCDSACAGMRTGNIRGNQ